MKLSEADITQKILKELFYYNPETGVFIRKKSTARCHKNGEIIGCINKGGYVVFSVGGKIRLAHRMAWIYCFGHIRKETIDHINGNRSDNRICNLREATKAENLHNTKANSRNKLGIKGVSKVKDLYISQIYHNGKNIRIGVFATLEEARESYLKKAYELRGAFSSEQGDLS